jgi:acetylornithine deacetylase/succinyl-diaminopimelate desuccinylase-like protein
MECVETRTIQYLEAHERELIDFTCALVSSPSMTPPGDERAMADTILKEMSRLRLAGVEVKAETPERPNILYRLKGKGSGPTLMYNAHLDTKPIGDHDAWETDPLKGTVVRDRLYGLGVGDTKAADAAMVYATAALLAADASLAGDLLLCLTADEEGGSRYGAEYLVRNRLIQADYAVLGEPSGALSEWENICIVARGIACCRVKVRGTQMHSSLSDILPSINASEKMAYVLTRVRDGLIIRYPEHAFCPNGVTVNAGVFVRGGVSWGVFPGYSEFGLDIRTIPGMKREDLEDDILSFLDELRREDPELDVELEFEPSPGDWMAATEIESSSPVVEAMQHATEKVFGDDLPLGTFPAATDASRFQTIGNIPTIPALGPGCLARAHSPNEYIAVDSILKAAKIYALGALALLH